MKIVLISTYDLGHQPFGLASPAAWLARAGHEVTCCDVNVLPLTTGAVRAADAVAFYLPMHTATRLAADIIPQVRGLNPGAKLIAYGLYAAPNADYLRSLGVESVISGEYEADLVEALDHPVSRVSMERLDFAVPDRRALPILGQYARLRWNGESLLAGYTEASRGCKHLCRHCPVVPVYQGQFRVVPVDIVMADIRQQVESGARHITFGDPDFFNGPGHALKVIRALHGEFPELTYDVTIKVEHLLGQRQHLAELRATGCLFVTSAVEAVDDGILARLEKGHTRADFSTVVELCRAAGLTLSPTFVAFTPWTSRAGYRDLLGVIRELDLVEQVAPVQLALRLLIPPGSRLLELAEVGEFLTGFDQAALLHRWKHPDPGMDALATKVLHLVNREQKRRRPRAEIFARIWAEAWDEPLVENFELLPRAAVPYLDEPWYC